MGPTAPVKKRDSGSHLRPAVATARADNPAGTSAPKYEQPILASGLAAVLEMVRADLEYQWRIGKPKPLVDYRRRFPDLFRDSASAQVLIAEEIRQRRRAGEYPLPSDYQGPFGPLPENWLNRLTAWDIDISGHDVPVTCRALSPDELDFPKTQQMPEGATGSGSVSSARPVSVRFSLPASGSEPEPELPKVGDEFAGFRLIGELGRGAFGHVYLANQGNLANRVVVLKVSTDLFQESQKLAQLHHPHVVPIYSLHQEGRLQAVCMPFFGTTTLADLLKELRASDVALSSGKALVESLHRKSSVRVAGAAITPTSGAGDDSESQTAAPLPTPKSTANLQRLARYNYVDAVLCLAAQLADGLSHAHERGILHRDLKPANILITEDGEPMLLDFNLAIDTKSPSPALAGRMGGTLPYMSPEQLRCFRGERCPVDARSDLYSLGVMVFELLCGHHPFQVHSGPAFSTVPRLLADRMQPPPDASLSNRMVSPAVAAILAKVLQPEPADRYQTAQELKEDLDRQLAHRPLRFARNSSLHERMSKWRRRHVRLATAIVTTFAASLLILGPLGFFWAREQSQTRLARATRDEFRADWKTVQGLLNAQEPSRAHLDDGLTRGQKWLERFQVAEDSDWRSSPLVRRLHQEDQTRLQGEIEELLLLLARGAALRAEQQPAEERAATLQQAIRFNELAEANARDGAPPRALWLQRAELARRSGKLDDADAYAKQAAATELHTPRDYYLTATEQMVQRRFREALPLLHEATSKDPQYFWAWFAEGMCHYELGEDAKALACYNAAVALWPDSHDFHFYRGLVYHRQGRFTRAQEDFDKAIQLRPDWADAWLNRGVVLGKLGKHTDAIANLSKAEQLGTPPTRVYFLRACARERVGDRDGARRDREEGMRREPTDEVSWIARGLARLHKDPKGALADFEQALRLNPRCFSALQNKAHVLADRLDQPRDAQAILHQLVESYPDAVLSRLGRGILRARVGNRDEALADAKECLARDDSASTFYHVANIYALTARVQKDDETKALTLLAKALRAGYGANLVAQDPDFSELRNNDEFRRLVAAAQTLGAAANRKE